jgi:hypothetical protein
MICPNCKYKNDDKSKFCSHCGYKLEVVVAVYEEPSSSKYPIDFRETLTIGRQIRGHFFKVMEQVVDEEIGPNQFRDYFDQFYKSEFYKTFDLRTEQLAEEVYTIHSGQSPHKGSEIDQLLEGHFYAFIDHFLVLNCQHLHGVNLPEEILQYENIDKDALDMRKMILDFLDFENEPDRVYTNFMSIPESKLKNAINSFLFAQSQERIFFICDQTIFGSCREGFAMTEHALHWKSHFNPPQSVFFEDLKVVQREAEWLNINGLFFNAHKSLNFKLLKLLKKIRSIYQQS